MDFYKDYKAMDDKQSKFFDDVAALLSGGLAMASGVSNEASSFMRLRAEKLAADLNLVTRETFEITQDMAAKARQENERLSKKIAALEERITQLEESQKPRG